MSIITLATGATLLSIAGLVAFLAQRHAWRWGSHPSARALVGAGAYRAAPSRGPERPRGVPPAIVGASAGGLVWAALTAFVFAPAGLLLAFIVGDGHDGAVAAATLGVICVEALALAIVMVVAAVALLRCRPRAHALARQVGVWSALHHVAVLAWFAFAALAERSLPILGWVSIPCVIGLAHALLLWRAGSESEPEVLHDT